MQDPIPSAMASAIPEDVAAGSQPCAENAAELHPAVSVHIEAEVPATEYITSSPARSAAESASISSVDPRQQVAGELADECVVCWSAGPEVIFQPCGHLCVCTACAQPFLEGLACPMCRQIISAGIIVQT